MIHTQRNISLTAVVMTLAMVTAATPHGIAADPQWDPKTRIPEDMVIALLEPTVAAGDRGDRHDLHWTEFARLRAATRPVVVWECNQSDANRKKNEEKGRKPSTAAVPIKMPPKSTRWPDYVYLDYDQFKDKSHYRSNPEKLARNDLPIKINESHIASLSSYTIDGDPLAIYGDLGNETLYKGLSVELVLKADDYIDSNGKRWKDTLNINDVIISYSYGSEKTFSSNAVGCHLALHLPTNRNEDQFAWEMALSANQNAQQGEEKKARIRGQIATASGHPFTTAVVRDVVIGSKSNNWLGGSDDPTLRTVPDAKPGSWNYEMLGRHMDPADEDPPGIAKSADCGDPISLHDVKTGEYKLVRTNSGAPDVVPFRGFITWRPKITNEGTYSLSSQSAAFKDSNTSRNQIVAIKVLGAGAGVVATFPMPTSWGAAFAGLGFLTSAGGEIAGADPGSQIAESKLAYVCKIENLVDGQPAAHLKVVRTGTSVPTNDENPDPLVEQSVQEIKINNGIFRGRQRVSHCDALKRAINEKPLSSFDAVPTPLPLHKIGEIRRGACKGEMDIGVIRYDTWVYDPSVSWVGATTSAAAKTVWRVAEINWSKTSPAVTP